jgi:hypothetical protein
VFPTVLGDGVRPLGGDGPPVGLRLIGDDVRLGRRAADLPAALIGWP